MSELNKKTMEISEFIFGEIFERIDDGIENVVKYAHDQNKTIDIHVPLLSVESVENLPSYITPTEYKNENGEEIIVFKIDKYILTNFKQKPTISHNMKNKIIELGLLKFLKKNKIFEWKFDLKNNKIFLI